MLRPLTSLIVSLAAVALSPAFPATPAPQIPDAAIAWPVIGKLTPRHARDIASSNWSIGGEVLDRDLAIYDHYKSYLGPLGAKHTRLQAGWAKTEKKPGVYDWTWLEAIVDDARAQSVQPWVQLSYGNPLYAGGGGPTLGDGVPTSEEALAAWDKWVRGTVQRLKDRVTAWEVWNEPEGSKKFTVEEYTRFYARTAAIVRAEQPGARLYALSFSSRQVTYAESFLLGMRAAGKLDLIDAITFHGYPLNPDDLRLDDLRAMMARQGFDIPLRQGETGAPSTTGTSGALGNFPGTELSQAKWLLRRMLAHRAQDLPFNLFLLMEFDYAGQPHTGMNTKGLLKANPDKTVAYAKPSYYAAQNVFSLFDDTLVRIRDFSATASSTEKIAVTGFKHSRSGVILFTMWLSGGTPGESLALTAVDVTLARETLREPVLADLRTGKIYAIPSDLIVRDLAGRATFKRVPLYDSPIVIAEKSLLMRE